MLHKLIPTIRHTNPYAQSFGDSITPIGNGSWVNQDKIEQAISKCTKSLSKWKAIKSKWSVLLCKQSTCSLISTILQTLSLTNGFPPTMFDWWKNKWIISTNYEVSESKIWNESNRKVRIRKEQLLLTMLVLIMFTTKQKRNNTASCFYQWLWETKSEGE